MPQIVSFGRVLLLAALGLLAPAGCRTTASKSQPANAAVFQAPVPIEEDDDYVRQHYQKHEYQIPMRDGVRLFTAVYSPRDQSQAYPMLLLRTPYSVRPYGENAYKNMLGPGWHFTREKFIFVYQDVRGAFMSEGQFVNMTPHRSVRNDRSDIDESTEIG